MRLSVILAVILFAYPVIADDRGNVGFIKSIEGDVFVLRDGATVQVSPGYQLLSSDTISTGSDSSAAIVFQDGTRLTLAEKSEIEVQMYVFVPHQKQYDFTLFLKKGSLIYSSGKLGKLAPEKVKLRTPRATVGIRGTKCLLSLR